MLVAPSIHYQPPPCNACPKWAWELGEGREIPSSDDTKNQKYRQESHRCRNGEFDNILSAFVPVAETMKSLKQ